MLRGQIAENCPDAVLWAVGFGRFFQQLLRHDGSQKRPARSDVEVLVVSSLPTIYEAHVVLAEKAFGPMLLEFGRLPNYHVWIKSEFWAAVHSKHETWRQIMAGAVSVYGSLDAIPEPTKPSVR
jgi:hypothetical protein